MGHLYHGYVTVVTRGYLKPWTRGHPRAPSIPWLCNSHNQRVSETMDPMASEGPLDAWDAWSGDCRPCNHHLMLLKIAK